MLALILTAVLSATPAPSHTPTHINPCKYEDGSGQTVCIWDAKHMGNGVGDSGMIINSPGWSRWVPLSHKQAHRLSH